MITYPDYLKEFTCSGGKCPDTCCQGWEIDIDDKTWKTYQKFQKEKESWWKGKLEKQRKSLSFKRGKCQFLDSDGLCQIQNKYGFQNLCKTCKEYPRHLEIYGGRKEWTLSLSCPEVAKLVLFRKEKVQFLTRKKEGISPYEHEVSEQALEQYCKVRDFFLELIQKRELSIEERIGSILVLAHDMDRWIRRENYEQVDWILEKYKREKETGKLNKKFSSYEVEKEIKDLYIKNYMQLFHQMEQIDKKCIQTIRRVADEVGNRIERENRMTFFEEDIFYENLIVYFLSVYVVGAVYDGRLESKVKLAVFSYLLVRQMVKWVLENFCIDKDEFDKKEEEKIKQTLLEFVWRYSRQLEHSSENLEWLEEILQTEKAFSYQILLSCIFS